MKLLVTGGLGFIGSNFIRHMLDTDRLIEITNVDNLSVGSNPKNLEDVEKDQRYRLLKGDITDAELVMKLVKKTDVIVNLAAETHVDRSIANPRPFLNSNIVGTFNILEAVRKGNPSAKMIHVSTDEVYGDILEGSFSEDDRPKPSNPYSASKASADMFVLAYHRTYELNTLITRCTNNFGPYQHPEKFIPKTIIHAKLGLSVPVYGKGNQIRDWIYVRDHCQALSQVITGGKAGEIYNVSAGNETTNLEIAKSILELLGKSSDLIEYVEDRPGHDIRYSLDSSKLKRELDWKPAYSFSKALTETVKWYAANESWWRKQVSAKASHQTLWKPNSRKASSR